MANYFDIFANKLNDLGVFQYLLPFILIAAITYAMFRKSKVLGDSAIINGIVSLSLTFMVVFGFPVATGFSIATPLATFFMQTSVFLVVFVIGAMMASIFYPNMTDWLPTAIKSRSTFWAIVAISVGLFITSGLIGVFTTGLSGGTSGGAPSAPRDVFLIASGIVIFIIIIMIATTVATGRVRGASE